MTAQFLNVRRLCIGRWLHFSSAEHVHGEEGVYFTLTWGCWLLTKYIQ